MTTSTIFYIGIDLGTSQSSIVTSTGKRLSSKTCVGYPKDIISQKRLNKEYLLGEEALKNRLSLNLVWPLAKGVICDDQNSKEATQLVLQDLIDLTLPKLSGDDKVYAAIGVPALASIRDKKTILEITKGFIDKVLIVSEPFAVAYGNDRFDESLIVDIGAGTTDLCRMSGSVPTEDDQRSLTEAGNFLDQEITDAILKKYPDVQLTPQIIKSIKDGIIVDDTMGAGQGNNLNGEFSMSIALGYRILNGEIIGRVKDIMVAGNVFDILKNNFSQASKEVWIEDTLFGKYSVPWLVFNDMLVSAT